MKKVMLPFLWFVSSMVTMSTANAGLYAGVDLGYASFASGYKLLNASSSSKSGQLADIHAGYRIGEIVAAELGYAKIAGVKANLGGREETISTDLFHASALAYLPLPTMFTALLDIYGRVGIGYAKGASHGQSDTRTSLIYGIGAEFNYLPIVAFRAEVQHIPDFALKSNALTMFKVGVNFKF
jgi:opacity protein-like surface antigen